MEEDTHGMSGASGAVVPAAYHFEDVFRKDEQLRDGMSLPFAFHTGGQGDEIRDADATEAMDDGEPDRGRRPNVTGQLSSWEKLLMESPNDSMAFYWREMVQWCKQRGRGAVPREGDGARGKRPQDRAVLDESMDTLSHLVKRFRCSDDAGGAYASPVGSPDRRLVLQGSGGEPGPEPMCE